MSKKKNPNIAKQLEYKIAAKSRRERIIMRVVMGIIGGLVVAVIAGIVIANVIQRDQGDTDGKAYVDYATESREETEQNNRIVATVNGIEVPYEALRFHTLLQKRALEAQYGEGIWDKASTAESHRAELEAAVIKSMQADYMILSACYKLGVNTEQETVIQLVNEQLTAMWEQIEYDFENGLNGASDYSSAEEMYLANLDELGMSENHFRTYYKIQDCLPQLVFYAMEEFGHFTYVVSNLDAFENYVLSDTEGRPNFLRTVQVMVEDEATARQIYEALKGVDDADERLTKMYGYISSSVNKDTADVTTDGYYFTRGEMVEAYENTAYGLSYGEVGEPVEVAGYWCVMMRLELEETYVTTHIATLLKNYQNTIMDAYVETFREACAVEYTPYGRELDLVAMQ